MIGPEAGKLDGLSVTADTLESRKPGDALQVQLHNSESNQVVHR